MFPRGFHGPAFVFVGRESFARRAELLGEAPGTLLEEFVPVAHAQLEDWLVGRTRDRAPRTMALLFLVSGRLTPEDVPLLRVYAAAAARTHGILVVGADPGAFGLHEPGPAAVSALEQDSRFEAWREFRRAPDAKHAVVVLDPDGNSAATLAIQLAKALSRYAWLPFCDPRPIDARAEVDRTTGHSRISERLAYGLETVGLTTATDAAHRYFPDVATCALSAGEGVLGLETDVAYVALRCLFVRWLEAVHGLHPGMSRDEGEAILNRWLKRYSRPDFDDWPPCSEPLASDRVPFSKVQLKLGETTAQGTRPFHLRISPQRRSWGTWFEVNFAGWLDLARGAPQTAPHGPPWRITSEAAGEEQAMRWARAVSAAGRCFEATGKILDVDDIIDVQLAGETGAIVLGADVWMELDFGSAASERDYVSAHDDIVRRAVRLSAEVAGCRDVLRTVVDSWPAWVLRSDEGARWVVLDGAMVPATVPLLCTPIDAGESERLREAMRTLQVQREPRAKITPDVVLTDHSFQDSVMKVELHTPCESFDDPSEDILREIFVDDPEGYWKHCPGNAGLHYFAGEVRALLILQFEAGHGFYVTYRGPGMRSEHELWTLAGPDGNVTLSLSGERFDVSARAFVPTDVAWSAIDAFVQDGRQPAAPRGFEWVANGRV